MSVTLFKNLKLYLLQFLLITYKVEANQGFSAKVPGFPKLLKSWLSLGVQQAFLTHCYSMSHKTKYKLGAPSIQDMRTKQRQSQIGALYII